MAFMLPKASAIKSVQMKKSGMENGGNKRSVKTRTVAKNSKKKVKKPTAY